MKPALTTTPCRSCGASIVFVRNKTLDAKSKWLILDPDPVPTGNIAVNPYRRTGTVLSGDALTQSRDTGRDLHQTHFRSCPDAAKHRAKKPPTPQLFEEDE